MADKFLNETGLAYYHNRAKTQFENKIEKIKVNGTEQTITNKEVNLDLTNYASMGVLSGGQTNFINGVNQGTTFEPSTNGLEYYADGMSDILELASVDYVDANGGKIDKIKVNGVEQTITNKEVNLAVPEFPVISNTTFTAEDDDNHQFVVTKNTDGALVEYKYDNATQQSVQLASTTFVNDAVGAITGMEFVIVDSLPTTGEKGKIYLVANSGTAPNTYDEYIWVGEGASAKFEKIGTTDIDLSNNWDQTNLEAITTAEIDTLFA